MKSRLQFKPDKVKDYILCRLYIHFSCLDQALAQKQKMRRIGKIEYDTKTVLGKGGFGVVFSGTFEGRGVAVKRVTLEDVNKREEDALNSLIDHPNVIKLLHTEKNDDFAYFALGLCKASMKDIFRPDDHPKKYKGPLPSDLDTMLQLSEGLAYIHDKGFVHRDVTPGNVLITYPNENGEVVFKWSDFGLSKPVSPKKTFSISAARGTPTWIAPEILEIAHHSNHANGKDHGTVESDTWSAGGVSFASLTKGKHPYGDSHMDIMSNMKNSNPINMKKLSKDHFAFGIITEMIEKDPAERMKLIDVVKKLKEVKLEMERELLDLCSRPSPEPVKLDRIASLLQLGIDPNCTNTAGQFPLLLCLSNLNGEHSLKRLELLLEGNQSRSVKLEGIRNGGTALHFLCDNYMNENIVDTMKFLTEKGVDVKLTDNWGCTALHSLCEYYKGENIVDAMKFLIDKGVDVKLKDKIWQRTALHVLCACYKNENIVDAMKILIDKGVDVKLKNSNYGLNALHLLCENYKNENIVDVMKFLIDKGVDVKVKDNMGQTALHYLCEHYKKENIVDAMMLLIENGVDVKKKDKLWQRTALHWLCANYKNENIVDAMKILINKGVDVKVKNNNGRTALHFLCEHYKNENIVDAMMLLIENGVDVQVKNTKERRTALDYLCADPKMAGYKEKFLFLFSIKKECNQVDRESFV